MFRAVLDTKCESGLRDMQSKSERQTGRLRNGQRHKQVLKDRMIDRQTERDREKNHCEDQTRPVNSLFSLLTLLFCFSQTHSFAVSPVSPGQTELGRLAWHSSHVIDLLSSRKRDFTDLRQSDKHAHIFRGRWGRGARKEPSGRTVSHVTLRINAVKFCRSASKLTWYNTVGSSLWVTRALLEPVAHARTVMLDKMGAILQASFVPSRIKLYGFYKPHVYIIYTSAVYCILRWQ